MEPSISINSTLALFTATAVLAAVPSVSVLAVSARSASFGFRHGALTAAGIVLGDLVFILVAVCGLALLAETMGSAFVLVNYAGGAYLLWLGVLIWRSRKRKAQQMSSNGSSLLSSFMTGLLITLGDQKAILFYLGFLPAFMKLSALTALDVAVVVVVTVIAVGGVKLAYAYAADQAGQGFGGRSSEALNILASATLFVAGAWVIVRA
jgi:threonine/homoserine/homoserine lactone efflux protein